MSSRLDPEALVCVDSSLDTIIVNPKGSISNTPVDGIKATYSWASTTITTPAGATDIVTIQGNSTKLIRILRIEITGSSGATSTNEHLPVILKKRLALNSGGTFTSSTGIQGHDSQDPLSTAIVNQYSVNPVTVGPNLGFMRETVLYTPPLGAPATRRMAKPIVWLFGEAAGHSLILHQQELVAVNLNSGNGVGAIFYVSVEWTEE